jgi:acylglycerol lipase
MSLFVYLMAAFAVFLTSLVSAAAIESGGSASNVIKKDRRAEYAAADKAKGIKRANAPCIVWSDANVPTRAVLLCIHGLGLHKDTYEAFGKRMQALGIATYAIDVRGFGDFMASKGHKTCDFDGCLSDVRRSLIAIRRANPDKPIFLLGESMGGAIALRVTAMYPELIDGLISSVPAGDRFKQGRSSWKVAIKYLKNKDKPFNVGESVIEQATQKPELREAWSKDPVARMNLSPKELMQFQMFMNQNHKSAKLITSKPVLIVQGCEDKLVKPEGTVELYNKLSTPDREIVLIPNAEHLIFEENQFDDEVITKVAGWIDNHISASSANQIK